MTGFAFGPIRRFLALRRCGAKEASGFHGTARTTREHHHQHRRTALTTSPGKHIKLGVQVFGRSWRREVAGRGRGHALGRIIIAGARAGGRQSGRLGGRKGFGNARPFASHHSHSAQPSRYTVTPSVPITMAISIRRSTGSRDDTSVPPLCWQQPRQSAAHLRTRN